MIFDRRGVRHHCQTEKLTMAIRNQSELPPTPDYTHLEPLPDPMDDLEARVYELEDELEVTKSRFRREQAARVAAESRAAEAEAEVARLREHI